MGVGFRGFGGYIYFHIRNEIFSYMKNSHTIPAVAKCLELLEHLCSATEPQSHLTLAAACDITPTTCYRILQTLLQQGWVRRDDRGGFMPGLSFIRAARSSSQSQMLAALERLQPVLDRLSATTGLSCKLSVRDGDSQLTVLRGVSPAPIAVTSRTGVSFPIIEGSVGAVLLSQASQEELESLRGRCRAAIEEKNTPQLLRFRLEELRQNGVVGNSSPANRWGCRALSAPVLDATGKCVAALTLLGSEADFSLKDLEFLIHTLKESALEAGGLLQ